MKSSVIGKNTSHAEVQDISKHGVWLYVKGSEYFLSYRDFPWFKQAKVSEVYHVKLLHHSHLHWPDLDVDLELESLQSLDRYPNIYR